MLLGVAASVSRRCTTTGRSALRNPRLNILQQCRELMETELIDIARQELELSEYFGAKRCHESM